MTTARSLKTRLTLLNTIVLMFILGAGGFFLYSTHRQQLLDQQDAELLSIAREATSQHLNNPQQPLHHPSICASIKQLSLLHPDKFSAAIFNLQGELICTNRETLSHLLLAPKKTSKSEFEFDIVHNSTDNDLRRLIFSINKKDAQLQLQIIKSRNQITDSLHLFALSLFLCNLVAVLCFAFCHWHLFSFLTTPLNKLTQLMAKTTNENIPQHFNLNEAGGKELSDLASEYNDLTERLALGLHKAQQFSADVTHELRTPLTILRGETELALRGNKDNEVLKRTLSSNLEEIQRMGLLIEDLLLLSKSELGEIPLKMEAINLGRLLDELFFQATIIADEKKIKMYRQPDPEQISLFADSPRLRQVFLNLLTNAIKYTPEGGSVTINWALQNDFVRVIIEDTGIGIDFKHQEHVFDRFYRIDKTSNRYDGGSGLGLAIAKWIVDAHKGSIRVCSEPGKGSCFTVMLPLTHLNQNLLE